MEKFIVSARKYRPDTFDSVIGQSSITETLKNAIKNNHLAQAYLFCGPRGIGKTTCARILAKTINCSNVTETTEACNECEFCKAFNEGRSYNIHELDAASNNSVDDIRNLIEQVRIPPQIGRYSIYIIDEVHMLSAQAFNAFLKTLEEPPEHAIFILATTEKHKIIPTILSRCQIYDFHRISVQDIIGYLESICKKEGFEYEEHALNVIAQKADGAMRDALSIFDQIVSFSGKSIHYKEVIENLNILNADYYFDLVDAFLKNDIAKALNMFDDILEHGFDEKVFIGGLGSHCRDLLVSKDQGTIKLLEVGETLRERYLAQTADCPESFLLKALSILNKCDISFNTSQNKRLHVELALISLTQVTAEKKKDELDELKQTGEKNIIKNEKKENPDEKVTKENEKLDVTEGKAQTTATETTTITPPKKTSPVNNTKEPEENREHNVKKYISIKAINDDNVSDTKNGQHDEVQKNEAIVEEEEITEENAFDHAQLLEKWTAFAEGIKEDRTRLYNMMIASAPVLEEGHKVSFIVKNSLQEEEFNSISKALLYYLQKELKNGKVQINTIFSQEQSPEKQRCYTDDDKYKHLMQKNPELEKLKQAFNLDFE